MTAKNKALSLFNKFFEAIPFADELAEPEHVVAKRCAILLVDEILDNSCDVIDITCWQGDLVCDEDYWKEVKNEIEKL